MTFKRNIPPKVFGVDHVEYIEPIRHLLKNGVELFTMNSGDQEVVKIDLSFKAGSWYGYSRLDSTMVASMLQEGTSHHKASEIANIFDFYGAQFSSASSYDNNYISLLSLKKHLPYLLPLVSEIIRESSFPEEEFDILRAKRKQRAIVDSGRVGLIAQKSFLRNVFAEVKTDKTEETVNEIFREIEKLTAELISEEELIPIQNYMLGRILEDFDGPFARAQTFASLRECNLDFGYYNQLINTIKTATPFEIRELARKYLTQESMSTVIAGKK